MIPWGAHLERFAGALGLTRDRAGLLRTGLFLTLLYALYALAFPDRDERLLRHVFGWGGTLAFLFLWWRGALQTNVLEARGEVPWRLLLVFFVLFAALAAAIRPFHSSDLHAYVTVGQLQAAYDLDPYVHTASDVPDWSADPLLSGTWKDMPCTYGFLFASLTEGVVRLGGGDLRRSLLLFKLLGVLALVLCAWLTLDTMRRHEIPGRGLALFTLLWSPYVLLHFVSNAHNDVWMALCLLVAFRCALDGRWLTLVPALVMGALFKHLALVLLPFAWVLLVRRHGWRHAALSTLLGCGLAALAALPYAGQWGEVRWEKIGTTLTTPWNSFQAVLTYSYGRLAEAVPVLEGSATAVTTAVRMAFGLAFLLFVGWRGLGALRKRDYAGPDFVSDGLIVLFVLLCIASAAWHPWYLGMFLPAIFLLPRGHPVRALTLWIAAFQMLAFSPLAKARVLEALVMLALPMWLWFRRFRSAPRDGPRLKHGSP